MADHEREHTRRGWCQGIGVQKQREIKVVDLAPRPLTRLSQGNPQLQTPETCNFLKDFDQMLACRLGFNLATPAKSGHVQQESWRLFGPFHLKHYLEVVAGR